MSSSAGSLVQFETRRKSKDNIECVSKSVRLRVSSLHFWPLVMVVISYISTLLLQSIDGGLKLDGAIAASELARAFQIVFPSVTVAVVVGVLTLGVMLGLTFTRGANEPERFFAKAERKRFLATQLVFFGSSGSRDLLSHRFILPLVLGMDCSWSHPGKLSPVIGNPKPDWSHGTRMTMAKSGEHSQMVSS